MIVEGEIARQIRTGKRNMLRLAAKSGRCPYRPNGVYVIQTERGGPTLCTITVEDVKTQLFEDEPVWILRFKRGDHTDKDRFPAARVGHGDYTHVAKLKLRGTDSEVSAAEQARYSAEAQDKEPERLEGQKQQLEAVISEIRRYPASPSANKRLRDAQGRIARIRPRTM